MSSTHHGTERNEGFITAVCVYGCVEQETEAGDFTFEVGFARFAACLIKYSVCWSACCYLSVLLVCILLLVSRLPSSAFLLISTLLLHIVARLRTPRLRIVAR